MIRLVLAVLLATALVGATLPALEDARTTNSERAVRSDLVRVERAVAELRTNEDAVAPGESGARRVLTIALPSESPANAPVRYVEFGAGDRTSVLAYALEGGVRHEIRLSADLRTDVKEDSGPLVLRRSGTYRVALKPVRIDGERAVLVRVLDAHV